MAKTIVGLFKDTTTANEVRSILVKGGYQSDQVRIVASDHTDEADLQGTTGSDAAAGLGDKVSSLFRGLSGGDDHAHDHYAQGVNSGGALLTVRAEDQDADEVASLLKQHGARDMEGSDTTTASATTGTYATEASASEGMAIPIVEEQLVVGKRQVDRGGVRVYSHVVERPVEAEVMLRDEQVNVQRRVVNRPATAADFEVGNRSAFELRAQGEEAVVGKSSRVVEEVLVGKQATEHSQAIHETVRKTQVDVEQIPGALEETHKR